MKNRMMLILSLFVFVGTIIVHFLHRVLDLSALWNHHKVEQSELVLNIILIIPALLWVAGFILFRKQKDHPWTPILITLSFTFSSISMMAGGDGMIEYHFSIFMVLAMIGYYESVTLVAVMTTIITLQHLLGYWFFTPYVFGVPIGEYAFSMVLVHAVFLIATSGAIMWQTIHKRKLQNELNKNQQTQKLLSEIIDHLSSTSNQLIDESGKLNETYEANRQAISQIVTNIQQISSSAEMQTQRTLESSEIMQVVNEGVQSVSETTADISALSHRATDEAYRGNEWIQKTVQQMELIYQNVEESSQKVQVLEQRSKEIDDIVDMMTNIASQTDLLALNAAIEAASAGEQGRGFSVVANEVKKLARQSTQSANEIKSLIQSVQLETAATVDAMERMIQEVSTGMSYAKNTGDVFQAILTSIQEVSKQLESIASTTEQVSSGAQEATSSIQEIAAAVAQTTDQTKRIADSSAQQMDNVTFLSELIATLNQAAQTLQKLVNDMRKIKL